MRHIGTGIKETLTPKRLLVAGAVGLLTLPFSGCSGSTSENNSDVPTEQGPTLDDPDMPGPEPTASPNTRIITAEEKAAINRSITATGLYGDLVKKACLATWTAYADGSAEVKDLDLTKDGDGQLFTASYGNGAEVSAYYVGYDKKNPEQSDCKNYQVVTFKKYPTEAERNRVKAGWNDESSAEVIVQPMGWMTKVNIVNNLPDKRLGSGKGQEILDPQDITNQERPFVFSAADLAATKRIIGFANGVIGE